MATFRPANSDFADSSTGERFNAYRTQKCARPLDLGKKETFDENSLHFRLSRLGNESSTKSRRQPRSGSGRVLLAPLRA
jgi:hypothetical protein